MGSVRCISALIRQRVIAGTGPTVGGCELDQWARGMDDRVVFCLRSSGWLSIRWRMGCETRS